MTSSAARPAAGMGLGVSGFVAAHGLHDADQARAGEEVVARVEEAGLRSVRIVVVDQHGLPRSKSLSPAAFASALANGADFSGAIYSLDSSNAVFPPPFAEGGGFGVSQLTGFPDVVVVPDPTTFNILPWADRTGWVLCDAYFQSGEPVVLDSRRALRERVAEAGALGFDYTAGLEVELTILALDHTSIGSHQTGMPAPAPDVSPFEAGYQFLSDNRMDNGGGALTALRDALWDLGMPPRSVEKEWGPGQVEITFPPMTGMEAADAMVLFRSAAKQLLRRRGLLATFMSWPALPNFFPSGWHLHESLASAGGANAFTSPDAAISEIGRWYAAGVLDHARAMTLLATPTVNGLRRFRPYSFAPDRIAWGFENRGVLLRAQGAPGDRGAHLENRLGEPAANPYLYMAASLAAGLDGIRRRLEPPPAVEGDPYERADLAALPASMAEAISCLHGDAFYRGVFGDAMVDYLTMMKRAELDRFEKAGGDETSGLPVTQWEMDEYLEVF
ncbi:MAG: glutamine synthetase family protein [Acidimicrobiales bacterium]